MTLNAYPGRTLVGRVSVVSAAVDPTTRTLHVRVVLPNTELRIKPAMFGAIRLLRSSAQGILVPSTSVVREGNDAYVYVSRGEWPIRPARRETGPRCGRTLEILSGLN